MQIQAPKGTKDVTPKESYRWQALERIIRDICERYGFDETRTPVFEHTELFDRGVGDTTDIVQKEMYTFTDRGDRSITLKPEGTAGVARMFIEHKLFNDAQPTKMYYLYCPVFRYEKPQAGRLREHHQFGVEVFGAPMASADAECILIALELFKTVGIGGLSININSIGCPNCRPAYNERLRRYFSARSGELCETCLTRLEKNPLRILDCKEEGCSKIAENAPVMLENLCPECEEHFKELKACLDAAGVEYSINPHIVRGLDYYTKTVFEIVSNRIGSQGTVCGGGRYDGLIEQLGGPPMPGVGFGLGMERLLLVAENMGVALPPPRPVDVYVAPVSGDARDAGFKLVKALRAQGLKVEFDHVGRSVKAQFKYAGKLSCTLVAVIGEDELRSDTVKFKNMQDGAETIAPFGAAAETAKAMLGAAAAQ
ncbi:MAG: histidine--tRNA ligase [Bacillota bacterium]